MSDSPRGTDETIDARKHALRVALRGRRPGWGAEEIEAASLEAQGRLALSPLLEGARTVGLYAALPSEVQTDTLERALEALGALTCYPAVRDDARALDFRRATSFQMGPLGVREPRGERVELAQIDLFVLPGLAGDQAGHRLGRGRGHYDATLAAAGPRALRVLLVFDWQVVPDVPIAAFDESVDAVCTESRLLRCARPREQA